MNDLNACAHSGLVAGGRYYFSYYHMVKVMVLRPQQNIFYECLIWLEELKRKQQARE